MTASWIKIYLYLVAWIKKMMSSDTSAAVCLLDLSPYRIRCPGTSCIAGELMLYPWGSKVWADSNSCSSNCSDPSRCCCCLFAFLYFLCLLLYFHLQQISYCGHLISFWHLGGFRSCRLDGRCLCHDYDFCLIFRGCLDIPKRGIMLK